MVRALNWITLVEMVKSNQTSRQYDWTHRADVRSLGIFIARKRSLGQDNIFRSMCQSFCSQGGWGVCSGGACSGEGLLSGGVLLPGGACSGGCLLRGGRGVETPRDSCCCGKYASYWNAFLFDNYLFLIIYFSCLWCGPCFKLLKPSKLPLPPPAPPPHSLPPPRPQRAETVRLIICPRGI